MNQIIDISNWQLLLGLLFILLAQISSFVFISALTAILPSVQSALSRSSFLWGFVLTYILETERMLLVVGVFLVMVVSAIFIIKGRVAENRFLISCPHF